MLNLARVTRAAGGVALLLFVFLMGLGEARDPDLGFHLAIGRQIRATGHILDHNPFTVIEPAPAWVLPQGVAVALFDGIVGWGGIAALILFKALLVTLTFALLYRLSRRLGASRLAAGLALALACTAASLRFVERPLLFSNLAFVFTMLGLCEARLATGGRRWVWLSGVTLALALDCHLHPGVVFAILVLALGPASTLLEKARLRLTARSPAWSPTLDAGPRASWILAIVAFVAVLIAGATLALYHPFPLRVLETPFVLGTDGFLGDHVIEFRPAWRFSFQSMRGYWFLVALGLATMILGARHLHAALILVPLAFLVVSLRHVRFIDLYALAVTPTLALGISALFAHPGRRRRLASLVLAAMLLTGVGDHINRTRFRLDYSPEVFAQAPLDFVQAKELRGPAFVSDGWAGPFLARLFPPERVFFFPAFDAFLPEHYQQYMDIRYGKPGWDTRLDALGIELCVLKYTSPTERSFQGGAPNLRQHLARDPRWALLYFDDLGEIFVRRAGKNTARVSELAITGLDPDRMEWFAQGGNALLPLQRLADAARTPGRRLTWALESARVGLESRSRP